jgi:multidrug efflux system membrane fusion protein
MATSSNLLQDTRSGKPRLGRALLRLAAVALAGAGGVLGWQFLQPGSAPHPVPPAPAAVPVVVGAAERRDLDIWVTGIGSVRPLNVVDVKVRVDGQLQAVAFKEGQDVASGQLLAQIDPRPYQAALDQAQANRQKDRAQFVSAQLARARASKLASAGAGTTQALETVQAQEATLRATLDADAAAIDAAALNLGFTRVTAPMAGRVGLRQVDAGSIVHASDATGLVTVTQMQPIAALFSLPQDDLDAVRRSEKAGPLPVALDSRDGTRHLADGTLVFVNSTVDPLTGQIQLKAEFANADRSLWPGEFVSARVLTGTDRGVITVPDQAVLTGQDGPYVYAVRPDDTVSVQKVTVGPSVSGVTEIRSGLAQGQRIVVDGQSRLAPGALVTFTPPPEAATPAAAPQAAAPQAAAPQAATR